jgi:hypothetical protein
LWFYKKYGWLPIEKLDHWTDGIYSIRNLKVEHELHSELSNLLVLWVVDQEKEETPLESVKPM